MKNKIKNLANILKNFCKTNTKMKLLVAYIIANLIYILVGSYIFMTGKLVPSFTYKLFSRGLRNLSVLNFIVFLVICFERKYKKQLPHFLALLIAIFGIIATCFAFNKETSLYGAPTRYEGLYSILYYLSIFLLSTFVSDKYKKFLVNVILLCGACSAIYGICQKYQVPGIKLYWRSYRVTDEITNIITTKKYLWVLGLTTNSNFFGTYMIICLCYAMGLFLDVPSRKKNALKREENENSTKKSVNVIRTMFSLWYAILITVFMFAMLISNTTSAAVGLIFVMSFILIYCIKNKLFLKFIVLIVILSAVTIFAGLSGKTKLLKDTGLTFFQASEVMKGNLDDSFGTNRLYIWKNTVKVIFPHFWHGVGIDGFQYAFDGTALTRKTKVYDKAHNEYLQTLITQGIFATTSYLMLYGYVVLTGVKHSFKEREVYLVLPIIGYLVQAFFNISVIEVAPMFWIALGLCCTRGENKVLKD